MRAARLFQKSFESAFVAFTFFPQNAIIYCKDGVREVFSCHSKSITTASSLSTAEINQLLDIASEMKRIVNSRVKRGPQLLGKSLAVLDFEGDLLAANTLKLACEYMSGISFCFSDCKNVGKRRARSGAGSKFRCTFK